MKIHKIMSQVQNIGVNGKISDDTEWFFNYQAKYYRFIGTG